MIRKEFDIIIDAPKEKVWDVLWNEDTYTIWTDPFMPGSRAVTDWKEGSKVKFLGPTGNGMVSKIKKRVTHEKLFIEHLGFFNNEIEDTESPEAKKWQGSIENYTLKSKNGKTNLIIQADLSEEWQETFTKAWPKALQLVKELSEK